MREREYLSAILSENGILRLETMRFLDEIRTPDDLGLPESSSPKAAAVAPFRTAIDNGMSKALDLGVLEDRQTKALRALVARKDKRDEDVVISASAAEEEVEDVGNLLEALRRSMRSAGTSPAASRAGSRRRRAGDRVGADERRRFSGRSRAGRLDERSKEDLYGRARELDIAGRSRMTKEELAEAIRKRA
jgi:DNA end-binding protein Ku